MHTYTALLRGINVSGHNKIKMADLLQLFLEKGFNNVQTYIQSGNVVFKSNLLENSKIEQIIQEGILSQFNLNVPVLVISKKQLITIFEENPFTKKEKIDITKLHVTLLNNFPELTAIQKTNELNIYGKDQFNVLKKRIYLYCPTGYGKTKLTNSFFEKKLNVSATTRNWKTITKLVELSNN